MGGAVPRVRTAVALVPAEPAAILSSSRAFVRLEVDGVDDRRQKGSQPRDRAVRGEFAATLRARRRSLRLRQDELADLAEVSERFVYALESGKPSVQLDKVLAVLNVLGLHLELQQGPARTITAPALAPGPARDGR